MQKTAGTAKTDTPLAANCGSCFVVKLGGQLLSDPQVLDTLAEDLAVLRGNGVRVTVVHGGGPQLSQLSDRMGIQTRKINGRRVTCDETLRLAKMVFAGEISTDIVAALRRHGAHGVGLSGVDGGVINAVRRSPVQMTNRETGQVEVVDFQHVGDIYGVDATILNLMMDNGFIPVVASLAADEAGEVLNINADTIAADIAIALGAKKLFMMSDVPGVLRDVENHSTRIPEMTVDDARSLIRSGAVGDGMIPKLDGAIRTIEGGVSNIHLMDGHTPHAILDEVSNPGSHGTSMTRNLGRTRQEAVWATEGPA
jgi:acetylglutamate kinase